MECKLTANNQCSIKNPILAHSHGMRGMGKTEQKVERYQENKIATYQLNIHDVAYSKSFAICLWWRLVIVKGSISIIYFQEKFLSFSWGAQNEKVNNIIWGISFIQFVNVCRILYNQLISTLKKVKQRLTWWF